MRPPSGDLSADHPNPMRNTRKRWALSQRELAHLLGGLSATSVGRIEMGRRWPTLPVALGYQVIFGNQPAELLPSLYEAVEEDVMNRAASLSIRLEGRPGGAAALKRRLLAEMVSRAGARRLRP